MKLEDLKTLITNIEAKYGNRVITYFVESDFDMVLPLLISAKHRFFNSDNAEYKTGVEIEIGEEFCILTFKEDEDVSLVNNPEKSYEIHLSLRDKSRVEVVGTYRYGSKSGFLRE